MSPLKRLCFVVHWERQCNNILFLYFLLQIIDGVRDEMINLHTKFCARNPSFLEKNGKVSIVAHSLGSVIAYDILTLWDIELRHLAQNATESTGFLTESFQYLRSVSSMGSIEQTESGSGGSLKENMRVKLAKARSEVMRLEAMVVSEVEHENHRTDKSSKECPFELPFKVRDLYTVFCASPVALLAGSKSSSDIASCNGLQWLERMSDCNKLREDVVRLIYLYLGKHEFFSPCLLRGSLAYIFSALLK